MQEGKMPRSSRSALGLQWREQSHPPSFFFERSLQRMVNIINHKLSETQCTRGESNSITTLFLPGLQSTDGVDFCDVDNCSQGLESGTAALSHL